ncbi:MAG TPA: hypothetical protein VI232_03735 [Reyranella sp.]
MPQQVPSPTLYSATTSDVLALARQTRAECLCDWMVAGWQRRYALYGGAMAGLAAYTSVLALSNSADAFLWTLAALVTAVASSITGFALSAIYGAMLSMSSRS